jgi:hypothetical protein
MSNCTKCSVELPSGNWGYFCNVCMQTNLIQEEAAKTRQANIESQIKNRQYEDQQLAAQKSAIASSELAKILSSISPTNAYQLGKSSVIEYSNDSIFIHLYFDLYGEIKWQLKSDFENILQSYPILKTEYVKGISNGISLLNYELPSPIELEKKILEKSEEVALGLRKDKFSLHTLSVNGFIIFNEFDSRMIRWRIPGTEYIDLAWKNPFPLAEWNRIFYEGVNRIYWLEINSQENLNKRISNPIQMSTESNKEAWFEMGITETPNLAKLDEVEISKVTPDIRNSWELISQQRSNQHQATNAASYTGLIGIFTVLVIVCLIAVLMGGFI